MAAEIISTVERRRRWPSEVKLRIMSEALEPGAVVAAVADRNGVCRSQLYTWLRLARDDRLPGISITPQPLNSFVPVRIAPPARPTPADCQPPSSHLHTSGQICHGTDTHLNLDLADGSATALYPRSSPRRAASRIIPELTVARTKNALAR